MCKTYHGESMASSLCSKVCGCYLIPFFMFSNFYQLELHNKAHVALANLQWIMCKNRIENRTSLALVMVIGSACLLFSQLVLGWWGVSLPLVLCSHVCTMGIFMGDREPFRQRIAISSNIKHPIGNYKREPRIFQMMLHYL